MVEEKHTADDPSLENQGPDWEEDVNG